MREEEEITIRSRSNFMSFKGTALGAVLFPRRPDNLDPVHNASSMLSDRFLCLEIYSCPPRLYFDGLHTTLS